MSRATERLRDLLIVGAILYITGGIVAVVARPSLFIGLIGLGSSGGARPQISSEP